jgi:branched-chain amino acid transport system permease protein
LSAPIRYGLLAVALIGFGVVVFLAPSFLNAYLMYLLTWIAIYAFAGTGLTVLMGWTGQVALAHAGFFGVGAYGTVYLAAHGWPWALAAIASSLVGAGLGVLVGLPAVRLRGFYLAIATLAFGGLLHQSFIQLVPITRGPRGVAVTPIEFAGIDTPSLVWYLAAAMLVVAFAVLHVLGRSHVGRCLKAVRDVEIATGSLGISATRYKLLAFGISAFIAGLAGAMFSQLITFLTPDLFDLALMVIFLVQVFSGGVSRLSGAVVGAIFVIVVREALQNRAISATFPQLVGSGQTLAFGLILILVVRFLPDGLASIPSRLRSRRSGPATLVPVEEAA